MRKLYRNFLLPIVLKRPRLRRFISSLLYPNENDKVSLFGVAYEVHKRKESFLYKAFLKSDSVNIFRHETPQITSLALLIHSQDIFIDVGANVGLHSAIYAKLKNLFPQFSIYAFEPNPDTFQRLLKTLEYSNDNTQYTNSEIAKCFNMGISNVNTTIEFVSGAGSSEFGVSNKSGWQIENEKTLVQCIRLDSFDDLVMSKRDIVLKVDVEGHEWEVLDGCIKLFDKQRIQILLIDGYSDDRIPDLLNGYGFKIFDAYSLKQFEGKNENNSIIAVHRNRLAKEGCDPSIH